MEKGLQIDDTLYRYRNGRCGDCGFTKGTAANTNGLTEIKAQLCAEIPEPFLCHFNAKDGAVPDGREVLCQGWIEKCNELEAAGHYANQQGWRREIRQQIVEIIDDIEANQESIPDKAAYFHERMMEVWQ